MEAVSSYEVVDKFSKFQRIMSCSAIDLLVFWITIRPDSGHDQEQS